MSDQATNEKRCPLCHGRFDNVREHLAASARSGGNGAGGHGRSAEQIDQLMADFDESGLRRPEAEVPPGFIF